ncbi:NAD(P)-dependent oxidoreductase [Streptomyces jumonjinensis]|uniref:Uncharacterized protein n=1 Tax=Streptomyces jumonjinensis TaxID=1945 RepID=A0A646KCP5_STRJU|nr:NAD(P)-dependent oxidoreductase [Streptomyces jumonjinensis]MQS98755.1 hypothetical protein [Streptomyces jumonjinensis]
MTRYRISGAVMTHPKRLPAAEEMVRSAPPGALRVVMDPDPGGKPSVLRTALAAWASTEEGATHQLVVQDDMILSDTFFERARAAVEEMPDAALALFALWDSRNGAAVRFGAMAGARWVGAVNEYFPCVAIILPRAVAEGFVEYGRARLDAWPDDILMYRYLRANRIPGYVSVPNLAEHEDHGSISGNAFRGPRRSVCFLPDDQPGGEGARLEGLRVVPFFKHGVAQCTVRLDGPGPERWLHLECEDYLEGSGVRVERLKPANFETSEVADPEAARSTWLTAFTMGFVHQRDGRGTGLSRTPASAEALATIGPGGVSHTRSEERIAEIREGLARIAQAGVEAGLEAGARSRSAGRPARGGTGRGGTGRGIGVLGGATPLGEHLVRGLADRGHRVTTPAATDSPAGLDALVDLRPLRDGGLLRDAHIVVRLLDRATGAATATRTLHTGDLYGPGCSRDTVIGRMVWSALRSHPVAVTDPPGDALRPLHTKDLIAAVSQVLRTPGAEPVLTLPGEELIGVRELAEAVCSAVRPVPIETVRRVAAASDSVSGPDSAPAPDSASDSASGPAPDSTSDSASVSGPSAAGAWARPAGWKPAMDLHHGLHTFAQWLAYEGIQYAAD